MRRTLSLLFFTALVCVMQSSAQDAAKLAAAWDKEHVTTLQPSDVRHSDLKKYLEKLGALGLNVKEAGRSNAGREIYQVQWGKGPLKVFLWSQMHGDEPTHTAVMLDLFSYLLQTSAKPQAAEVLSGCTLLFIPMLNPDGAEAVIRYNAQGIDINRDWRRLASPEGRALLRAALCVGFPIGLLWCAVSPSRRSLQDAVLRTSVVYDWRPRGEAA